MVARCPRDVWDRLRMDIKTRVASVQRFLVNEKYELDVYQRGYVWGDREIRHFLTDLEDHAADWTSEDDPPPWFLGTVLVERRGGRNFLVDGQQRVVTLGLLLLALHSIAEGQRKIAIAAALKGKDKSLALPVAVGRYQLAFAALARGAEADAFDRRDPDQRRIAAAYFQLRDWVGVSVKPADRQPLIDCVLKLCLLNVVSVSDTHLAYRLFNSLNSRGKPLSPVETLKAVLLADLPEEERLSLAAAWDAAREEATKQGSDDPTLAALRSALIARAAPNVGGDTAFAAQDEVRAIRDNPFEWLANQAEDRPPAEQIARELPFFIRLDGRLAISARAPMPGAEAIHFITATGIPQEHWAPLFMSPLSPDPTSIDDTLRKASAVLAFLDIVAARIAWRRMAISPAQIRDALAGLTPHVRQGDPEALAYRLAALLEGHFPERFTPHDALKVGGEGLSEKAAHALIARLTAHLESVTRTPAGDYIHFVTGAYALTPVPAAMGPATPGRHPPDPLRTVRDHLGAWILAPADLAETIAEARPEERAALLNGADARLTLTAAPAAPSDPVFAAAAAAFDPPPPAGPPEGPDAVMARTAFYAALARQIWTPERIMEAAGAPAATLQDVLGLRRPPPPPAPNEAAETPGETMNFS